MLLFHTVAKRGKASSFITLPLHEKNIHVTVAQHPSITPWQP